MCVGMSTSKSARISIGMGVSGLQLPLVSGAGMGQSTLDAGHLAGAWSLGLELYAACLAGAVAGGAPVRLPLPAEAQQLA